ncbi:hypothetical protein KR215_002094, partial [Drosophila sulfurigaster]
LEEMDNDRLNELESILYASIHYSDATSEEQHVKAVDVDARSMPPPLQQQQQHHRFVSGKRVINNATTTIGKPRYWIDNKGESNATIGESTKSPKTSEVPPNEPKTTAQPKRMLPPPPATTVNTSQKANKVNNAKKNHPKPLNNVQQLLQNQQQLKRKQLQQATKKQQRQQLQLQLQQQSQQEQRQHQQQQQQHQQQQQQHQQQRQQKPPKPQTTSKATNDDEPERFDQRLLVAIPPNWPKTKREPAQRAVAPFGKANRKLEQLQKLEQKRQKSKQARATNKKLKQTNDQPVEMIDLVDSETSSNGDDVVIVPLPPVPIIDVDASEDEQNDDGEEAKEQFTQPYLEENAMDAADVKLGVNCAVEPAALSSALTSPCNSVLSSDDFIVQKDTSRLLADHARATDEDLLVLTENAIRNAAEPDSQTKDTEETLDNSSEYEFVPPSKLEEIKQNFRVDEQQFRALDVYESESDLTESGIYCKAKQKATPTIIRSVDTDSNSSDVEAVIEDNVVKTKRLRKRRASSTKDTQSDPNNELDADETDSENDDVEATGVPGIARGMAVERCKRKIRRISQRRCSESAVNTEPRKLAPIEGSSDSGAEDEALPTARQIAERLLKQEQEKEMQAVDTTEDVAMVSEGSDANTEEEAEINEAITEDMSTVFKRIDASTERSKRTLEANEQATVSTTEAQPEDEDKDDVVAVEMQTQDFETVLDEEEEQVEKEEQSVLQLEHNMSELKEDLTGGDLVGWNDEMCRFYNDSWNGEQFNMNKLLKAMSGQRHEWRISNADRYPVMRKRSNLKCTNCFEMGHMRAKCPRPRKPVTCYTCGTTGHAEPRCPNAICLGCGAKQALYVQKCNKCSFLSRMICQLCKMRGHSTDMCPDKWRRYHSTTRSNVSLESTVQYRTKHCSYCAARGHLFEECRQRIGEYRNTNYTTTIMSHQKVYKDRGGPLSYLGDSSTFFSIETPFHFNWSSEFSKNSCYARFLKAVGLARPQKKTQTATLQQSQQLQRYSNDYVPNPLVHAALGNKTTTSPSTSTSAATLTATSTSTATVIIDEFPEPEEDAFTEVIATPVEETQQQEFVIDTQSKPAEAKTTATTTTANATTPSKPAINKSSVTPHDLDSDSNYSFSEHFEVPSSTTTTTNDVEIVEATTPATPKSGPMENLPEMIPLSSTADDNEEENVNLSYDRYSQGISMCVTSKATSTSTSNAAVEEAESLPDVPSEAKILMAQDQTQYLFSPEGCQFLTASAKKCNVSVRMDFKEYGYVLVIYGLKKNQEELQLMLLHRNREVKRRSNDIQRQKPPKRIDVLIRFLRDGINSLNTDLGNAKTHFIRIKELEEMNTKNGFKLAERKRRLLNMILFGQAGLGNGSMHLDQLLVILKRLLERSPDENATPAMRNEIEEHYSVIFSAQPNDNYEVLLQNYAKLDIKNRLKSLNIEPAVLGLTPRKANPTPRRLSSPPPPPPVWTQDATPPAAPKNNRVAKPRALLNAKWSDHQQPAVPPPPVWQDEAAPSNQQQSQQQHNNRVAKPRQQQQQRRQLPLPPIWQHEEQQQQHANVNNSNNNKLRLPKQRMQPYARPIGQQQSQLPCNNMQQRAVATGGLHLQRHQPLQSECVRLLAGMERDSSSRNNINTDSSKPSIFWSRESLRYLDEMFRTTANPETLERLHRVLDRSRRGELSHNDYRAVIRLHSLMGP